LDTSWNNGRILARNLGLLSLVQNFLISKLELKPALLTLRGSLRTTCEDGLVSVINLKLLLNIVRFMVALKMFETETSCMLDSLCTKALK
jgi:hypothetical protein